MFCNSKQQSVVFKWLINGLNQRFPNYDGDLWKTRKLKEQAIYFKSYLIFTIL